MGLLDSIAGQVLGSLATSGDDRHSGLVDAIGAMLGSHPGGLSGLVAVFEQQGLGNLIGSWIGTGQNQSISTQQLQAVLGSGQIEAIARQLGFSPQEAAGHLSELLPQIVDRLTPHGALPTTGDPLGGLLGALRGSPA
jgi:uncharacterized protein YidB (DUF937 family)